MRREMNSQNIFAVVFLGPLVTFLLIYLIYLLLRILTLAIKSLIQRKRFIEWSREQKLVLVNGGPLSGKKTLLSFLADVNGRKMKLEKSGYINSTQREMITEFKKQFSLEEHIESQTKNNQRNFFLISEEQDSNSLNKKSSILIEESIKAIRKIDYYNNVLWISFSSKNGVMWNLLASRANSIVKCHNISNFLWLFKVMKVTVDDGSQKSIDYGLLIWNSELLKAVKFWNTKKRNEDLLITN